MKDVAKKIFFPTIGQIFYHPTAGPCSAPTAVGTARNGGLYAVGPGTCRSSKKASRKPNAARRYPLRARRAQPWRPKQGQRSADHHGEQTSIMRSTNGPGCVEAHPASTVTSPTARAPARSSAPHAAPNVLSHKHFVTMSCRRPPGAKTRSTMQQQASTARARHRRRPSPSGPGRSSALDVRPVGCQLKRCAREARAATGKRPGTSARSWLLLAGPIAAPASGATAHSFPSRTQGEQRPAVDLPVKTSGRPGCRTSTGSGTSPDSRCDLMVPRTLRHGGFPSAPLKDGAREGLPVPGKAGTPAGARNGISWRQRQGAARPAGSPTQRGPPPRPP